MCDYWQTEKMLEHYAMERRIEESKTRKKKCKECKDYWDGICKGEMMKGKVAI